MLTFLKNFFYFRDLRQIAKLQHILFSTYSNQKEIEKVIHGQRLKVSRILQKRPELAILVDVIFSLNQLRHRVRDFALYEVCAMELKEIDRVSCLLLLKGSYFSELFLNKVHAFEAMYNNTLRVVAPDPIVFLFFIQDLYAFHEQVELLYDKKAH